MYQPISAFITDIVSKRSLIYELSKRDFQQQYQGSYLGIVWMFLQPLLFISVLYLIFSLGFKAQATMEIPFSLYLVCGMVSWLFFVGNLSSTTNVIHSHAYLVKKVDFRLSILPIVKILSSLIPHLFLVAVAIALSWYHGYHPGLHTIQIIYYLVALSLLLLGIGWLTSSTSIFVTDVSNVVTVITQFGFWLTPIFWNISMIPERYHWLIKLNPLYYIVSGYRDSIILGTPFWAKPEETLYFWGITILTLVAGIHVYRKLRPHFAEVV